MTPPPLRRRRAKAKVVRGWATTGADWYLPGKAFFVYPSLRIARRECTSWERLEYLEVRTITAPKRGRKKGKR